ncbi:MAG: hypothetical protein WDW36_010031 [Sanguina aurantia]
MNRIDGLNIVEKQQLDFVSEVDKLAEAEIIRELRRAYPDHSLAEESGLTGKGPMQWVIDPLDGTHNYLRGIPHFCVSIALLDKGVPVHRIACSSGTSSVCTKSLLKAGCIASAIGGASTTSAKLVTSIVRRVRLRLVMRERHRDAPLGRQRSLVQLVQQLQQRAKITRVAGKQSAARWSWRFDADSKRRRLALEHQPAFGIIQRLQRW